MGLVLDIDASRTDIIYNIFDLFRHTSFLSSIDSVTNSSSGLIFVKIRAESGRIFSKNPGKNPGETKFCDSVVFL